MSPLSSTTSFPRFLAFSAGRRRESTCASRRLPRLRWDRCLGLAGSVRFGFLGSTAKESVVVRFISRAGLSAGAEDLLHDAGATVAILAGGYALVFGFNDLTRREVLQQGIAEGSPLLCFDADVVFSYFLARFPSWDSFLGNDVWRRW